MARRRSRAGSRFGATGWIAAVGAAFALFAVASGEQATFKVALVLVGAAALGGALGRRRRG